MLIVVLATSIVWIAWKQYRLRAENAEVVELIAALGGPDRALAAERIESIGSGAVPLLLRAARESTDAEVRNAAARMAVRIGLLSEVAGSVDVLMSQEEIRAAVLEELVFLNYHGTKDFEAINRLAERAERKDWIHALDRICDLHLRSWAELFCQSNDPDAELIRSVRAKDASDAYEYLLIQFAWTSDSIDDVVPFLNDASVETQLNVMRLMSERMREADGRSRQNGAEAFTAWLGTILSTADPDRKHHAAICFGLTADPSQWLILRNLLSSDHSKVRLGAIEGLGLLGNDAATPDLRRFLRSSSWRERRAAIATLGLLRDEGALEEISEILFRDDVRVRMAAVQFVEKIGSSTAGSLLVRALLESPAPDIGCPFKGQFRSALTAAIVPRSDFGELKIPELSETHDEDLKLRIEALKRAARARSGQQPASEESGR